MNFSSVLITRRTLVIQLLMASDAPLLTRQVGPTRQILRKLFNGDRLPSIPMTNESGSQYEFKGTASIGRLLTGGAKALVSPTGFEPVLLP
jgi:hypothetical protein